MNLSGAAGGGDARVLLAETLQPGGAGWWALCVMSDALECLHDCQMFGRLELSYWLRAGALCSLSAVCSALNPWQVRVLAM